MAGYRPDIAWSQIEITLTTHDEGGVTDNDFERTSSLLIAIKPPPRRA